jgi:hypothetical protein
MTSGKAFAGMTSKALAGMTSKGAIE